jgi:hypothetical protein
MERHGEFTLTTATPFDIESLQRIEPPWQAIKEWIPDDEPNLNWFNMPRNVKIQSQEFDDIDQSPTWQPDEIQLDDGRTLRSQLNLTGGTLPARKNCDQKKSWECGLESDSRN